jgi:hypothetical protein
MKNEILKEQLEKFKLYSKYNTSRTLHENVENIFEQPVVPNVVPGTYLPGPAQFTQKGPMMPQFGGVPQEAVDKIMAISAQNKKNLTGSYLFPNQEKEIDKEFGDGTYQKFWRNNGKGALEGKVQIPTQTSYVRTTPSGYNLPQQTNQKSQLSQNPVTPRVDNKPKVTFKPNDNFPIKFMDSGEKVKQLQTVLGVVNKSGQANVTGKFYTSTEQKLANKMKELGLTYDRNKGVDEETFNLILNGPKPSKNLETPITVDRKDVNLNVPKELPKTITTQAPTIQTPQTDLPLEQQFQLAKIELQKAKEGLDAAQQTRDRAQIGAARGVQQAARKKVQDLRAQLYPPQQ